MSACILEGDVFAMLPTIAPGSIDACCTSPPYWRLRSYLGADHPLKPLEIGQEPTPAAYVETIVRVMRLVRDCLADHGVCWLNIGDTFSSKPPGCKGVSRSSTLHGARISEAYRETLENSVGQKQDTTHAVPSGSLCLIPQRLAIALADDGWIVRSQVCWVKPSAMPASLAGWSWRRHRVKMSKGLSGVRPDKGVVRPSGQVQVPHRNGSFDTPHGTEWADCPGCPKCLPNDKLVLRKGSWRPTSAWEPVLMLAKGLGYFSDGEPVKTPAVGSTVSRDRYTRVLDDPGEQFAVQHDHETTCDSGANLRDVWTIASESLKEAHYAAFPTELVRRCLLSSVSAKGYCPHPNCGKPWVRVIAHKPMVTLATGRAGNAQAGTSNERGPGHQYGVSGTMLEPAETTTLGWRPSCKCPPAEPRPGRVLDPFAGSSRTGLTAVRMGLDFVGVELNTDYAALSSRLLSADMPLFGGTTVKSDPRQQTLFPPTPAPEEPYVSAPRPAEADAPAPPQAKKKRGKGAVQSEYQPAMPDWWLKAKELYPGVLIARKHPGGIYEFLSADAVRVAEVLGGGLAVNGDGLKALPLMDGWEADLRKLLEAGEQVAVVEDLDDQGPAPRELAPPPPAKKSRRKGTVREEQGQEVKPPDPPKPARARKPRAGAPTSTTTVEHQEDGSSTTTTVEVEECPPVTQEAAPASAEPSPLPADPTALGVELVWALCRTDRPAAKKVSEGWSELRAKGCSDHQLLYLIQESFGFGGGRQAGDAPGVAGCRFDGAIVPKFWLLPALITDPPTLQGEALVKMVREVLMLPYGKSKKEA